mgnify:CR=1 FL=1
MQCAGSLAAAGVGFVDHRRRDLGVLFAAGALVTSSSSFAVLLGEYSSVNRQFGSTKAVLSFCAPMLRGKSISREVRKTFQYLKKSESPFKVLAFFNILSLLAEYDFFWTCSGNGQRKGYSGVACFIKKLHNISSNISLFKKLPFFLIFFGSCN